MPLWIMIGDKRQQAGLFWILLNLVQVPDIVHGKDAPFCFKEATHHNVILRGGLEAGEYTPWEPSGVSHMTPEKCTEHCCQSPDTDAVFLLDSYCFCVKCRSIQLCSRVKITPPSGYNPVTVTVVKSIFKLSTTTKPLSYSGIFTRTKSTESSTQCTVPYGEKHSCGLFSASIVIKSPPPSNPSKKKQKEERKSPKMSRQNPPRRRVIADSDEELGKTTVSSGDSEAVRKLFRLFSRKHNPHTALLARYAVCFLLGGLVGLIPYLVFVIELCKANLEIKNSHLPVSNGNSETKDAPKSGAVASYTGVSSEPITTTANIGMNFTKPNISSAVPTTPHPTRVVNAERQAEGTGNDDISLQCPGSLKVIRVGAFGISGDNKTVEDFDKHCQANLALVDKTKVCIVSLKRVYKSSYPPFIKTLVTYTCSYTEFISKQQ